MFFVLRERTNVVFTRQAGLYKISLESVDFFVCVFKRKQTINLNTIALNVYLRMGVNIFVDVYTLMAL